jgi:hypothetical protein
MIDIIAEQLDPARAIVPERTIIVAAEAACRIVDAHDPAA